MKDVNLVCCKICGQGMKDLTSHIFRKHDIKAAQYREQFPGAPIRCDALLQQQSERISGDKNPAYQHGGKYSPFSEKFVGGTEKIAETKKKAQLNRQLTDGDNTKIGYWLKKTDGDVEEAKRLLSERQSTFSLEKCIKKHGEAEGRRIWQERQDKWMDNLNSKSEEEKSRINRLKVGSKYSISAAEKEIVKFLTESGMEVDPQFSLFDTNKTKQYIYDVRCGNKIIEYHGDWWHCNPNLFKPDYFHPRIHLTSEAIWARDKNKEDYAVNQNYELLVIWETDYKKDKNGTLDKCLNFLRS